MVDLIHKQTSEDNWQGMCVCVCVCYLSGLEMVLVANMAKGDAGMLDGQKSNKMKIVIDQRLKHLCQKEKQTNETERREDRRGGGEGLGEPERDKE